VQPADAGGFFQDGAACQRLLRDQKPDLALTHKGGGTGARRGVGEENLHVALAHVTAVTAERAGEYVRLDAATRRDAETSGR